MFFSTYVLTKKGPLAKVWLAAHWDKRLTRNEIKVADLSQIIMHIVRPVVPIALRTSGELLVGVVRIYALKVKYFLKEVSEATVFLRVNTSTAIINDGNTSGGAAGTISSKSEGFTTANSILVNQKGDMEAVPIVWGKDLVTKYGSFSEAAEAFCEGRFDAIADLLGAQQIEGPDKKNGLLPSAWYTVQPLSQNSEGLCNSQQSYDEIAKMRADLMAFHERASGSSTSKSKSSLSSIEKGRGSAVPAVGAGEDGRSIPYPSVTDELDIGIPLPDEMPSALGDVFGSQIPGYVPEDLFILPVMGGNDRDVVFGAGTSHTSAKKVRPANIQDLATTTLSRETFEAVMSDRSSILNKGYRRGPFDEQEHWERYLIANIANPYDQTWAISDQTLDALPIADVAIKSLQPNATLRVAYATALHQQVHKSIEEAMNAVHSYRKQNVDLMACGTTFAEVNDETLVEPSRETNPRKRARQGDDKAEEKDDPRNLSQSAIRTFKRIRDEVFSQQNFSNDRDNHQSDTVQSSVVGSCLLNRVCRDLCRRDAARTFVDILVLASKRLLEVSEDENSNDIKISLKSPLTFQSGGGQYAVRS